jgi:cation diffusion facilitator CzcD-associated flavoprotein CzcO
MSAPQYPQIPGMDKFAGESCHTALWPADGVAVGGKRVGIIGTGSSGVQLIQTIAGEVGFLTVFQRTPNWNTPLNNQPIPPEEMAHIKATYGQIHQACQSLGGFVHHFPDASATDHTAGQRRQFWEELWRKPGFASLFSNYPEVLMTEEFNSEFCEFVAAKIRQRVNDPRTAEKLVPSDHGYAAKRPPMEIGYYEVYNRDNVELVDVREDPILEITETGIKTTNHHYECDVIVYATGFDVGTGAFNKIDISGVGGKKLTEVWSNGPLTRYGIITPGFPNLLMVGGAQSLVGNVPRAIEPQVEFVSQLLKYLRRNGYQSVDVDPQAAEEWVSHVADTVAGTIFDGAQSWQWGANVPGKARSFLLYPGGLPAYKEWLANTESDGYREFLFHLPSADPGAADAARK